MNVMRKKSLSAKITIGAIILSLAFLGCDGEYYDVVSRSVEDPLREVPVAIPFQSIDGISVTWNEDPLADSFILYRKLLPVGASQVVYAGESCEYVDALALPRTMYEYTLSKVRGTKEFPIGAPAYCAFDERHPKDPNGFNDTLSTARCFTTFQISDFIVYYSDISGHVISDRDWYYMDLDPHTKAWIKMPYWDCDGSATLLDLAVETDISKAMSNADQFSFSNGENFRKRIFFSIGPCPMTPGARKMWSYTLDFVSIETYNP